MSGRSEQQRSLKRTADGDQENNGGTTGKRRKLERSQGNPSSTTSPVMPSSATPQATASSETSLVTPSSATSQVTALSATSQVTPSSATSQVTPSSATPQVTPSSATSQVTPSSTTSPVTHPSAIPQVTPSSATSHVTPSSAVSQVTPSSATSQVTPSSATSQFTPMTVGGVIDLWIFRSLEHSVACNQWKKLGRELGMAEYELYDIASNNPKDISEQLYQMLLKWKESRASGATTGHLISALRRCDFNQVADDLCKDDPNLVSEDSHPYREHIEQIRTELIRWYKQTLSRLHPIPWCPWVESDFTHMFTNLHIVRGRKHQRPMQGSRRPNLGSPAPPQGPSRAIHTEERLVESLWGTSRRTVSFIEGTAGIGKSCLCHRLVLSWANDTLSVLREKFTLMLILEARTLKRSLEECTRQLFAKDFPLTSDDINQSVTKCQEKCLFIIDGVDELTGEGEQAVQELLGGTLFRCANVLLTGRPESAGRYIKHVNIHLRIKGFTLKNAKFYIHKFFDNQRPKKVRNKLIERIKRDKDLKELTQTPFTTLLMCLLAEDCGGDIPNTRNGIMGDIVQLTARRYVSKPKSTSTEDTTVEAIVRAAAQVAFKGETTGKVVFKESDLEKTFTRDMSDHLLLSGLFNRDFILSRLDTRGCCCFPHKSIQDFLCARHLADLDVDSLKTTLTQNRRRFHDNPTLCEMLLNMLRDQADKYGTAMAFYWSEGYSECKEAVMRSAVTVTDSRTLDTIIGVFCQYLSHDLGDILHVPGGVRLYNLIVRRILPVIMWWAERIGQNTWRVYIPGGPFWPPYSRTTPDQRHIYSNYQRVHLPVTCGISLTGVYTDEKWQDVTFPWVLASPGWAIDLTERPARINVLCVCVTPSAECITSLSSLIDRTRSSDLIVFILKPRAVTYEDSVYLRVLEMCKRAHSNPVRVSSCTVLTEAETKTISGTKLNTDHKLSTSPLQIHYNRHCPF